MAHPIEVVLQFEHAVNSRNPQTISSLMTPDGEFIDSLGTRIQGTERLNVAWAGYFKMFPDYSISHSEIFANGDTVAMFGMAQGTLAPNGQIKKENFWKTHAAWRAVVRDGKIALWQVYADNEPVRAIMHKKPATAG
ncbi:MAG TPA: nuclear transport factor 2 family protein [Candidatus Sulfotelmatobacter sp.]|nr:nuclear transport factor 2 family protein [Candidatus Sulfotelmatobacter sp.]